MNPISFAHNHVKFATIIGERFNFDTRGQDATYDDLDDSDEYRLTPYESILSRLIFLDEDLFEDDLLDLSYYVIFDQVDRPMSKYFFQTAKRNYEIAYAVLNAIRQKIINEGDKSVVKTTKTKA